MAINAQEAFELANAPPSFDALYELASRHILNAASNGRFQCNFKGAYWFGNDAAVTLADKLTSSGHFVAFNTSGMLVSWQPTST
jgi:hypothetical protein